MSKLLFRIFKQISKFKAEEREKKATSRKRAYSAAFPLLHREKFEEGHIVWAKFSKYWWAAITLPQDLIADPDTVYNVFWFSDSSTSKVSIHGIVDFKENFQEITKKTMSYQSKNWKNGVVKALSELHNNQVVFKAEDLQHLAVNGLQNNIQDRRNCIPDWIINILQNTKDDEDVTKIKCPLRIKEMITHKISKKDVLDGSFCMGCYASNRTVTEHPMFNGQMCVKCLDRLKETLYVKGDDGLHYYCSICGNGGHLVLCDKDECGRGYCNSCVSDFSVGGTWLTLTKKKNWPCFLCEKNAQYGLIIRRDDFNVRIHDMYKRGNTQLVNAPSRPLPHGSKLRVLSLYDGISTGMYTLQKLNIPVEVYYASEVDKNAINISKMNFGDKITYIGDITKLTDSKIEKLSPIHLVIGGSPCNDLSLVNPARKGLYNVKGTGCLFFEFVRIISTLNRCTPNGLYWLFENVAAMELNNKEDISVFLECEPVLIDAVDLSAQHRPRLFWGNIPTLIQRLPDSQCVLQDLLMPHRKATVSKLRTITTNRNSLKQGKNAICPVINEQNEEDVVWITELERVFGFPLHYTDVGNLSAQQRQQALGRAWSVPVIQHLFGFLPNFCPAAL